MSVEALHRPEPVSGSSSPPKDFNALLAAVARKKDRDAFAALFDHYAPRIKSYLIKGGAAPDAAEELAQETMMIVWQRAPSFDPKRASATTWIYTIARNKRIDALRRVRPDIDLDDAPPLADAAPDASESLEDTQESAIVEHALSALPKEQSSLLYQSFFEDKSHAEIAKESGLPLGTVKSRIRLALEKLSHQSKVKELWS